jgi:RNA-directed DNA polymerase
MRESPNTRTEETETRQDPPASQPRQGKKRNVHARSATVFSRKNLELAGAQVTKNRGSAGLDEVSIAQLEARKEDYRDLLPRQLRAGTDQPKPVTRVEIANSDGGVRKLGRPAGLDRVCQQALVQRRGPLCDPTCLDSAFGSRPGRSPHDAMRKVWQERNAGSGGMVEADLRQVFDTIDQEPLIDVIAEEIRDGGVLQLVRDMLRAGVMEGGGWQPTLPGVPQGGVARPLGSKIFLTPFDRWRTPEGCRLTRWADDVGVLGQTRAEAQRARAVAERFLRAELGVERPPQTTRMVQISHGCECLGYKVMQGAGHRRPAHKRRGRAHPHNLYAIPREQSVPRFKDQIRARTRRKAPLTLREVLERSNPVRRGWGHVSRKADVRRLFPRLAGWIERRLSSFLAKRWRNPRWRRYPTRRLIGAFGLVRLTHLIPGLVR